MFFDECEYLRCQWKGDGYVRREVTTLLGREDRGLGSRERGTDWRKSWRRS